ncbi:hypothetical protein [Maribacter sp. 2307UL18-2]|uniref:hypothetical protein n=1 Tax=Maribacter sp. 2307UL18-2 TaxID=3386274 RepID=UPI0039BD51EF
MKRLLYILLFAFISTTALSLTSCREDKKDAGDKIEEAVDDTGDAIEEGAEEVEDEIDDATDDN